MYSATFNNVLLNIIKIDDINGTSPALKIY